MIPQGVEGKPGKAVKGGTEGMADGLRGAEATQRTIQAIPGNSCPEWSQFVEEMVAGGRIELPTYGL